MGKLEAKVAIITGASAGINSSSDGRSSARDLLGLGEPEFAATAALYFASDNSKWITGRILPVDGGASAN